MPVRIAVIGTGHMGRHHAVKVAELCSDGGATFTGIADIDPDRRRRVAAETGARAAASSREITSQSRYAIASFRIGAPVSRSAKSSGSSLSADA